MSVVQGLANFRHKAHLLRNQKDRNIPGFVARN